MAQHGATLSFVGHYRLIFQLFVLASCMNLFAAAVISAAFVSPDRHIGEAGRASHA